ncbi:WD40 repeat domain-containing protein [Altericista sp. CCNU0014]|uniref:WD40 repeat domain-containing protein n=1 Tax=Altericista sp. CCNU0014 TaxID=3082949 RepID=UPI00384F3FDD
MPAKLRWIIGILILISGLSAAGSWLFSQIFIRENAASEQTHQQLFSTSSIKTLTSQKGAIYSLAISPDGNTFVSGSGDNTVAQWDLKTGMLLRTFLLHSQPVVAVAIAPDGRTLVSGSRDRTIGVWDLKTGQRLTTLPGGKGWVKAVAFGQNSDRIAAGNDDGSIAFWALNPEKFLRNLPANQDGIEAIAFSPDSSLLASSGEDNTIKLWDPAGQLVRTLTGHKTHPEAIVFTPDGESLIGGDTKDLRQWNVRTGTVKQFFKSGSLSGLVRSLAVSPDGKWLASGHTDNTIRLWAIQTGELLSTFAEHKDWVLSVALSPDGKTLISGGRDKTIKLWKLKPEETQ